METLTKIKEATNSSFVTLFNDWQELNNHDNRTEFKLDLIEKFITDTKERILGISRDSPSSYRASLIHFLVKLTEQKELLEDELRGNPNITEQTQPCSNCLKDVPFNPRYTEYVCEDCREKETRDSNGTLVSFCNSDFGGGLLVIYHDENNKVIREDKSFRKFECFIDGKPFIASPAYFGGIIIQKKT
ncbi:MAG: hypothetical protein U5N85_18000 [Arcicella sp.]|nr:hypothetical protein [Arcicella sp.]